MPNIHLRNNYQKAVVCMVLAYISIALMGVFVKYASDELPSSEILFSRFFIGFVFLLPFLIKDGDFKVDMSQWKFLVLRNLAGIASMLLTFYAIKLFTDFHCDFIDEYVRTFLCLYCCFSLKSEHH